MVQESCQQLPVEIAPHNIRWAYKTLMGQSSWLDSDITGLDSLGTACGSILRLLSQPSLRFVSVHQNSVFQRVISCKAIAMMMRSQIIQIFPHSHKVDLKTAMRSFLDWFYVAWVTAFIIHSPQHYYKKVLFWNKAVVT